MAGSGDIAAASGFCTASALMRKRVRIEEDPPQRVRIEEDLLHPSATPDSDSPHEQRPAEEHDVDGPHEQSFAAAEHDYFLTLTEAQAAQRESFSVAVECVGIRHHDTEAAAALEEGSKVKLVREPWNEIDINAIAVCVEHGAHADDDSDDGWVTRPSSTWKVEWDGETEQWRVERGELPLVCVGMLGWEYARELAPILDGDEARVVDAEVEGLKRAPANLTLRLTIEAAGDAAEALRRAPMLSGRKVISVGEISAGLAQSDVDAALQASQSRDEFACFPPRGTGDSGWKPSAAWQQPSHADDNDDGAWPWPPYDPSRVRAISLHEVEEAERAGWPPPDDVLIALGVAPADEEAWWSRYGLRSPTGWGVHGAVDLIPLGRQSISANNVKARVLLDGAAHGSSPWLPATLEALHDLMHEPAFWCRRKPDSFIRSFGGPYVLGQDEGKLKLINGAPHTELTQLVCQGHSLVYTLTHLALPIAPGFNTLIFGLNLRSAGFYYHQDADVAGLSAKNAPLKPSQPVVTTVLYEKPGADSAKEVVLWRPTLNWDTSTPTYFGSACGLLTSRA